MHRQYFCYRGGMTDARIYRSKRSEVIFVQIEITTLNVANQCETISVYRIALSSEIDVCIQRRYLIHQVGDPRFLLPEPFVESLCPCDYTSQHQDETNCQPLHSPYIFFT